MRLPHLSRRGAGLLAAVLSLAALAVCGGFLRRDKTFSQYCVPQAQWETLQAQRTPAPQPLLASLCFNDYDLILDEQDGRFYYSLIEGDSRAFDPPVRWRAAGQKVQLAILDAAITPGSIAANADIQLMAYTDTQYYLYHLSCTTLPLLDISGVDIDAIAIESLRVAQRPTADMSFYLFDNRANAPQRITATGGSIHVRGQSAALFPKKAYRITLMEASPGGHMREWKVPLLGMRADGDWLLYAAYNDPERVRNVFSSQLWMNSCADNNSFGVQNGMEYRHVELFWDGAYAGLYAIGFPIDEQQLQIASDLVGYTEFTFKKLDWVASEIGIEPGQPFMYGYELRTLDDGEAAAWQVIVNYYVELLYNQSPEQVRALVDMDSAIDLYLFYNLIQGYDNVDENVLKNTYITFKQRGDTLAALYTPWDMDLTWGTIYSQTAANNVDLYAIAPAQNLVMELNPVYRLQLLGDVDINAQVRARYAQLRAGDWSDEGILALLDGMEAEIFGSGAYARDILRWPNSTQQDPALGLSVFKAYVLQRLAALDAFVEALP